VTRLLPHLPTSLQLPELAEAASHLNRLAERLSTVKTLAEERQVVQEAWERAGRELAGCRGDGDAALIEDQMAVVVYLSSIEHWALTDEGKVEVLPWIGKLLLSEDSKARTLGYIASTVPSLLQVNHGCLLDSEEPMASLLLANTISKVSSLQLDFT